MTQPRLSWRTLGLPVYLVIGFLIIFAAIFVYAFTNLQPTETTSAPITADSYQDRVAALLANAQPADAEAVVEKYGCGACHRVGAANGIAPSWVGIAERAATRRPPLTAAEYIYESITDPGAYVVDGYPDVMPKDFAQRMSDQELGDIIAYLLTPDAK